MYNSTQKNQIHEQLINYLKEKKIEPSKKFKCLSPIHEDKNPSMSFDKNRNRVHCFACGVDYDIFDLIGIEYNLYDWKDIYAKAVSIFIKKEAEKIPLKKKTKQTDYIFYLKAAHKNLEKTNYPALRGISKETCVRFNVGYDEKYKCPVSGKIWQALIIPTSDNSFLARNTDLNADKNNRIRKNGASLIYNSNALAEEKKEANNYSSNMVFVVEGEIDALSIEECGKRAVALGSTSNYASFLRLLEINKPIGPLLLALDNDEAGEASTSKLKEGLKKLSIAYHVVDIYGKYKDANEALCQNRNEFERNLENAENLEFLQQQQLREAYRKNNATGYLQNFVNGLLKKDDIDFMPTGFSNIDKILEGGLFEGLYLLGGLSSLGKTSFVLQLADQLAINGSDVLFFSLEMSRTELIAKSISRLTLLECLAKNLDISNAKTTRGITTSKFWENYSKKEKDIISKAIENYSKFSDNLYIFEGVGDISVGDIREKVKEHYRYTGKKPVVFIDYVQILNSNNKYKTDKQNIDNIIIELKRISRDFKIAIMGLSSFNRANYTQAVSMEAFKESGSLEYSSDVLMGIQLCGAGGKMFDVDEAKKKNPREIEMKILKNRNGPTGGVLKFSYHTKFNYFKES